MPMSRWKLLPGLASIVRTENAAFVVVEQAPPGHINRRRIGRIEDDVVEDVVIGEFELGKELPRGSAIVRGEDLASARTDQYVLGIAWIVSQTANIAPFG